MQRLRHRIQRRLATVCLPKPPRASARGRWLPLLAAVCLFAGTPLAHARMGLIVGEPFGSFGTMMPQGHTSVYLPDLCVATPVQLRPCRPGEMGAVVSRYHDLRHPDLDWMAFPLTVFLYGTPDPSSASLPSMTAPREARIREAYWRQNLQEYIPARLDAQGNAQPPAYGDWEEGIGAAYDRRLLMYSFDTTPEQDATVLAWLNDRPNRRSYTLTRHNCADFAADLLRIVLPPAAVHRNVPADFDMTTPKQLARSVDGYGLAHPELHLRVYEIPQLPGTLRRSRPIRGAAESLLTTKRYMATLLIIQPEIILAAWIDYEKRGKWPLGQDAVVVAPEFWQPSEGAGEVAVAQSTPTAPAATSAPATPVSEPAAVQLLPAQKVEDPATGAVYSSDPVATSVLSPATGLRAK